METSHVYQPSAWGKAFHALTHDEALGAGSAGVGKSVVLMWEPLAQIVTEHARCHLPEKHPLHVKWGQSKGWALFLRRTYGMLDQAIGHAKVLFPQLDPGVKWSEEHLWFKFSSGFTYQYGHCHKPDDWQRYFSQEYTIICFDELIQFMQKQYENIKGRCRSSDPVLSKMRKVRAMSNPVFERTTNEVFEMDDPFWVRKYFVDPAPDGGVTIKKPLVDRDGTVKGYRSRIYLPGRLHDNPNKEFVAQYEATLLDQSEAKRQALLYGNWYFTAGQYFTEAWNPDIHVVAPFAIPQHWRRFRCMDWGFKKPGCVIWWALDPEDNLYAEREYTFQLKRPKDVAKEIKRWEATQGLASKTRSFLSGPADTQIWEDKMGERTIAQYFLEEGVDWTKADKRSRKNNAMLMLMRMQDHHHGTTKPGFMVFAGQNPNLVRTIPMLPPGNPVDPDDPGEITDDHWLDTAFYACAYASNPAGIAVPKKKRRVEDDDEHRSNRGRSRRGRRGGGYGYGDVA